MLANPPNTFYGYFNTLETQCVQRAWVVVGWCQSPLWRGEHDATMVMHGSCVFVQESAKAVEPGWLDGARRRRRRRTYIRSFVRLSLTSSVWKSTWSTLKVDTYCLQLAIKALAYLESIHCRVYRLLFPQRVCRGAVAYSTDYGHPERGVFFRKS